MKKSLKLILAVSALVPASLMAQTPLQVDRSKYPDYSDVVRPDGSLLKYGSASGPKKARAAAPVSQRPAYWNNAATKHFPPVFNQHGGSCGAASRIAYMFTHEVNSYRDLDGSKYENQYPTHFVFLHTNGNSGKDEFVRDIGIPNAPTWGGRTYSSIFGEYGTWTSHEYGWMQGYDRWYSAMFNRMTTPTHLPVTLQSEEGREALKNYLWNHNGDADFKSGGIVGVGVASAGKWLNIPSTAANDAAGVTGKWYVKEWGKGVDHALTIVGYDDRIEFDLDDNGVKGEVDKDEVGAWIVVNSWGDWCNNGFIYCPYGRSTPVQTTDKRVTDWWQPEIYHYRKEYRPFRTLKVKMDYSHRSEIKLIAGVAKNLNATAPEKSIELEYFRFAGDGHNGDSIPAPATPMLGKWSDGRMHTEPMEFGYDLTDLSANFDRSQPLKYFFQVYARTKRGTGAIGSGNIHAASILDYEFDKGGNETPFKIESAVPVRGGSVVTISTIVYGEQYGAPVNLNLRNAQLSWQAPQNFGRSVAHYNVYQAGTKLGETTALTYDVSASGSYAVSAVYDNGVESKQVAISGYVAPQETNTAVNIKNSGFIIPDIFKDRYDNATIEYWIKPNSLSNWNQSGGPGWGTFMFHANNDGTFSAGWDNSARVNSNSNVLSVGRWDHVAMVAAKSNFRLLINGSSAGSISSSNYSGLGGFGDLVFRNSGNGVNDATYDEIRVWGKARIQPEIDKAKNVEFSGELMPQELLAYYKGDVILIDGHPYLRDCVGGHHARIIDKSAYEVVNSDKHFADQTTATLSNPSIQLPTGVQVGQMVDFSTTYGDNVKDIRWTIQGTTVQNYQGTKVCTSFAQAGTYEVSVTVTDSKGATKTATKSLTVAVAPAPVADFTFTTTRVPAGERVSFSPTTAQPGYIYQWSMPGAVTTSSSAITAGTSYEHTGEYAVTLTVTSPTGQTASSTQKLSVVQVAPQAEFSVLTPIVVKGETVSLKDESKFDPSQWSWQLSSRSKVYAINDAQHPNAVISEPGIYDVSLVARNAVGMHSTTQERALVVTNADSKNGLTFGHDGSVVLNRTPLAQGEKSLTIEWWMNPEKLTDYCCGIGEDDQSFQLKVGANGALSIGKNGRVVSTAADVVKAGEWHHYAVTIRNGNYARIYCDGVVVKSTSLVGADFPVLTTFRLGTPSAKMNAAIDEFRVWGTDLTEAKVRQYANEPITDVAAAEAGEDKLLLYYDFNQNSGAVKDRCSSGNNGERQGFGPDGDAWALSKGVFSLNFSAAGSKDLSARLSNYRRSFASEATQVNQTSTTTDRWYAIKGWTVENTAPTATGGQTGVHVDRYKGNCFTVATGWDGFATTLADHKAYQVVTLPAGVYTLTATYSNTASYGASAAPNSYLVVTTAATLPNTSELNTALAYNQMSATGLGAKNSLTFTLNEETQVALGLLVNMSGNSIAIIDNFRLMRTELETITAIRALESLRPNVDSQALYDLNGRRVLTPQRGQLYIQGGQRIWVK